MNLYDKFGKLKKFTDNIGTVYGTEDFAIYLYSVIKMIKPKTVLELGTGFGTTMLWAAMALQENQSGTIHTIDDGSEWELLKQAKHLFEDYYKDNYNDYVTNIIKEFDVSKQVSFYNQKISKLNYLKNIDIVFSDFSHGTYSVIKLLADYLPNVSENSYIFIDSAGTYYSSFLTIKSIVDYLNENKIPKTLAEMVEPIELTRLKTIVSSSRFDLINLIENKNRNQNSTVCIKISPVDIMPQPRINIRF